MADVQVKVDLAGVVKKVSPDNVKRGKIAAGNQAMLLMEPYVPMRDGPMRVAAYVDGEGDVIYHKAPYVRPQFYGTNGIVIFRRYTTPGTGKRWDKPLKANVDKLKRVAVKAMGIK